MTLVVNNYESCSIVCTPFGQQAGVTEKWFDTGYLLEQKFVLDTVNGRGQVHFFTAPKASDSSQDLTFALRHYYRGGLIAMFSSDTFIYQSIKHCRCYKELEVLLHLATNNVNVPIGVATRIVRTGMFYRADIITVVIEHTQELHQILQKSAVERAVWQAIGREIKKMHLAGVRHDDINVKNVLVQHYQQTGEDANKVFLIDFDKCERKPQGKWQQQNLLRLKRSLDKQATLLEEYHFQQQDWQVLIDAYNEYQG